MPLTVADTGEEYVIKRIGGKPEVKQHLENLGFVVGGVVSVINTMSGNVIVMPVALPSFAASPTTSRRSSSIWKAH